MRLTFEELSPGQLDAAEHNAASRGLNFASIGYHPKTGAYGAIFLDPEKGFPLAHLFHMERLRRTMPVGTKARYQGPVDGGYQMETITPPHGARIGIVPFPSD